MTRVFVYGTLKRGIHNHHLLADAQYVGQAYTIDTFRMHDVGFPVIRFSDHPDAKSVFGEVYDVNDRCLRSLDRLENEGVMYDRKQINVILEQERRQPDTTITVDANVAVYVGNDKYWDQHQPREFIETNNHGELEWHC